MAFNFKHIRTACARKSSSKDCVLYWFKPWQVQRWSLRLILEKGLFLMIKGSRLNWPGSPWEVERAELQKFAQTLFLARKNRAHNAFIIKILNSPQNSVIVLIEPLQNHFCGLCLSQNLCAICAPCRLLGYHNVNCNLEHSVYLWSEVSGASWIDAKLWFDSLTYKRTDWDRDAYAYKIEQAFLPRLWIFVSLDLALPFWSIDPITNNAW